MEPTLELAEQLDRDRWEAASAMTFEQRALSGVAMFDLVADAMRAGIRMQFPSLSPDAVHQILDDRLQDSRHDEART